MASTARRATSRTRLRTSTGSHPKAAEGRTIPTCRPAAGALIGAALLAGAAPAVAAVDARSPLASYARARAASGAGAAAEAVRAYRAALAASPDNPVLARRALSEAIEAGDRGLAVEAARALSAAGALPAEGALLLTAEAFRTKDWRSAETQIAAIEKDEVFAFTAPILRAWLIHGRGKGDPIPIIDAAAAGNPLLKSYAPEHRGLLLLVRGRRPEGILALAPSLAGDSVRAQRLRIAAASLIASKGEKKEALALLEGNGIALSAARRQLASRGKLAGAPIVTPGAGAAELLVRLAVELSGQDVPELTLSLARLATFAAPESPAGWIVAADVLAGQGRHAAALGALAKVAAADPFGGEALERRIGVLVSAGRGDEALAEAGAAAEADRSAVDPWSRLGDILVEAKKYDEASQAYAKALELAKAGAESRQPLWGLWLLQGSALVQAGRWPEGKAALEEAHRLSPGQAVVLNYLGYSQLERRENLAEAERLIREASRLQPDDPAITDSLGWAFYVRGDLPKAVELLERAARAQPADAAINEHLGDAYYSAGRRFEARYAWQAALTFAEGEAVARLRAKLDAGLRPELAAP